MSEGAPARSFIDTYEEQYEMQQSLGADVEAYEEYFDDIGKYAVYFGLPDDLVITQDQAWVIAYQALIEQGTISNRSVFNAVRSKPKCSSVSRSCSVSSDDRRRVSAYSG